MSQSSTAKQQQQQIRSQQTHPLNQQQQLQDHLQLLQQQSLNHTWESLAGHSNLLAAFSSIIAPSSSSAPHPPASQPSDSSSSNPQVQQSSSDGSTLDAATQESLEALQSLLQPGSEGFAVFQATFNALTGADDEEGEEVAANQDTTGQVTDHGKGKAHQHEDGHGVKEALATLIGAHGSSRLGQPSGQEDVDHDATANAIAAVMAAFAAATGTQDGSHQEEDEIIEEGSVVEAGLAVSGSQQPVDSSTSDIGSSHTSGMDVDKLSHPGSIPTTSSRTEQVSSSQQQGQPSVVENVSEEDEEDDDGVDPFESFANSMAFQFTSSGFPSFGNVGIPLPTIPLPLPTLPISVPGQTQTSAPTSKTSQKRKAPSSTKANSKPSKKLVREVTPSQASTSTPPPKSSSLNPVAPFPQQFRALQPNLIPSARVFSPSNMSSVVQPVLNAMSIPIPTLPQQTTAPVEISNKRKQNRPTGSSRKGSPAVTTQHESTPNPTPAPVLPLLSFTIPEPALQPPNVNTTGTTLPKSPEVTAARLLVSKHSLNSAPAHDGVLAIHPPAESTETASNLTRPFGSISTVDSLVSINSPEVSVSSYQQLQIPFPSIPVPVETISAPVNMSDVPQDLNLSVAGSNVSTGPAANPNSLITAFLESWGQDLSREISVGPSKEKEKDRETNGTEVSIGDGIGEVGVTKSSALEIDDRAMDDGESATKDVDEVVNFLEQGDKNRGLVEMVDIVPVVNAAVPDSSTIVTAALPVSKPLLETESTKTKDVDLDPQNNMDVDVAPVTTSKPDEIMPPISTITPSSIPEPTQNTMSIIPDTTSIAPSTPIAPKPASPSNSNPGSKPPTPRPPLLALAKLPASMKARASEQSRSQSGSESPLAIEKETGDNTASSVKDAVAAAVKDSTSATAVVNDVSGATVERSDKDGKSTSTGDSADALKDVGKTGELGGSLEAGEIKGGGSGYSGLKCDLCDRRFARIYNLQAHIKTHSDERNFKCTECDQSFTRKHDLQRHQKRHSNAKPYVCNICGRSFARRDALKRHENMDIEGKRIYCTVDPSVILDKNAVDQHLRNLELHVGVSSSAEKSSDEDGYGRVVGSGSGFYESGGDESLEESGARLRAVSVEEANTGGVRESGIVESEDITRREDPGLVVATVEAGSDGGAHNDERGGNVEDNPSGDSSNVKDVGGSSARSVPGHDAALALLQSLAGITVGEGGIDEMHSGEGSNVLDDDEVAKRVGELVAAVTRDALRSPDDHHS
ncbi:hypothetical protein HDU76_011683 [Blyttiomyces sp. JEL0837]|nr:hypothetical protein HDU76_011683 [Blyttiomyces sp. JEL0837]